MANFADMGSRMAQWWQALPEGTGAVLLLLVQLLVVVVVLGWAHGRGFRAHDRGRLVRLPLLVIGLGLALLVRHLHGSWWETALLVAGLLVAGFLSRNDNGRGLAVPVVMVAALLGHELLLSAVLLTLVAFIAYLLSPVPKR